MSPFFSSCLSVINPESFGQNQILTEANETLFMHKIINKRRIFLPLSPQQNDITYSYLRKDRR